MSIAAGRTSLAVMAALIAVGVGWFALAWSGSGPWAPATVWPAMLALVALVWLAVAVPMFSRFVEVRLNSEAVVLRRVLAPRKTVPLSAIEEVILLRFLRLPARHSPSSAPRVVLRDAGGTIDAFSPRSADLVPELARRGLKLAIIHEPLTPLEAARRYPKSVGVAELLVQPLAWAATVLPVLILVWAVWYAVAG